LAFSPERVDRSGSSRRRWLIGSRLGFRRVETLADSPKFEEGTAMAINPVDRNLRSASAQPTEAQQPLAAQTPAQKAEDAPAAAQTANDSFSHACVTDAAAARSGTEAAEQFVAMKEQRRAKGPDKHDIFVPTAVDRSTSPFQLTNNGGAVLNKPVINNIYLGDYWKTSAGKKTAAYNDAFATDIEKSTYMDVLKQYGVGKGSFAGSTMVPGAAPKKVNETDIQNIVKKAIASGTQSSDPQAVHTVILPPGTVLTDGQVDSTQGLGGYHGSYKGPDGKPVYYAAIVYSQGKNGIDFDGTARDNISIIESHEWSEAETDPDVNSKIKGRGLAWYNNQYGEIGDEAIQALPLNQVFDKVDGYEVQKEWSNKDKTFEVQPKSASNGADTGNPSPG
jgi:ABC-type transporter MlaC component